MTGAAFIHDIVQPEMLHARVLRQPSRGARLTDLNEAAIRKAAGGEIRIVRVGDFVAFVGLDETLVQRAAVAAPVHAHWTGVRVRSPPSSRKPPGSAISRPMTGISATPARHRNSRPFVAHAALAPSCGLAEYRDGHLSVWSHTQGVYPLRNSIADILGLKPDQITVRHAHGARCYGHNGADDAALDAAIIAMQIPACNGGARKSSASNRSARRI